MPAIGTPRARNRALPGGLGGAQVRSPGNLTLEDVAEARGGFLDRLVGDLKDLGEALPRGILDIVTAAPKDVVRGVRTLVPGGDDGFAEEGSSVLDDILVPLTKSLASTANVAGDGLQALPAALGLGSEEWRRQRLAEAGEHSEAFFEHPGAFAVEHIGNAALVGGAVAKPLAAGARAQAGVRAASKDLLGGTGRRTRLPTSQGRAANRAQLADLALADGPGAGLARASRVASDVVGGPYRAAARTAYRTRLPAGLLSSPAPLGGLLTGEGRAAIAEAPRLPSLADVVDQARTGENVTSSTAKALRDMADTDFGQALTARFGRDVRQIKRKMTDLRGELSDRTQDVMGKRSPEGRRNNALEAVRLAKPRLAELGVDVDLPRLAKAETRDAALLDSLRTIQESGLDLDAELPRLAGGQLDLAILDAWERTSELPDGALRDRLTDDAVLADLGERNRTAQAALREAGAGDLTSLTGRAFAVDPEMPVKALSEAPAFVQRAFTDAGTQLRREASTRDAQLAGLGVERDRWGLQVDEAGRALEPDALRPLELAGPSRAQGRRLKNLRTKVTRARETLTRLTDDAERGSVAGRVDALDDFRLLSRQTETIARRLDTTKLPDRLGGELLTELNDVRAQLDEMVAGTGLTPPRTLTAAQGKLGRVANDPEAPRGALTPLARGQANARRPFEERLVGAQVRARIADGTLQRSQRGLASLEQRFAELETSVMDSLDAAPAVARPYLKYARDVGPVLDRALREHGLDDLADQLALADAPKTLAAMNDAGVTPTFLRRLEDLDEGQGTGYRASTESVLKTPTPSYARRRTLRDIEVEQDIDRIKATQDIEIGADLLKRETAQWVKDTHGRSADRIAETVPLVDGKLIDPDAWRDLAPSDRERLLKKAGFNAYRPEDIFTFRVRRTSADDVWIPTIYNDALVMYSKQNIAEFVIGSFVNPAVSAWKNWLLPFRPAWHVYNAVGGAVMAMGPGKVGPAAYLEFMRPGGQAAEMLRRHREGFGLTDLGLDAEGQAKLFEGGVSRDLAPNQRPAGAGSLVMEQESLKRMIASDLGQRAGRGRRALKTFAERSYTVNSHLDNLNRASVYLYETLKNGGDAESGLRLAGEVMGDYSSMTPFERTYVRTVFPFYTWMRHISMLSLRMLAPDNITRTTILAHFVQVLGEPGGLEEMLPDYASGDIQVGESDDGTPRFLSTRGFNPFQDIFDPIYYNGEISARGLLRSANPALQFAYERQSGLSTLTGRPFSRPVPVLDSEGRELPTAPGLGTHLAQRFLPPQFPAAQRLFRGATGQTQARYGSGDPVLIEGAEGPSATSGLTSLFGANVRAIDVEESRERSLTAQYRNQRRQARYDEALRQRQ